MAITSFRDTRIEGTVTAENEGVLMTSIPYTRGWKVTVDGERAEILPIGENGLAGVKIPAGTHTVIFSYNTGIFIPAVLVSLLGILCFLLLHRKWKDPAGSKVIPASAKMKTGAEPASREASGKAGGKDVKEKDPDGSEKTPASASQGTNAPKGSRSGSGKRKKKKKGR